MDELLYCMMLGVADHRQDQFRQFCCERGYQSSNLDEKIRAVYEFLKSIDLWSSPRPEPAKSAVKATEYRTMGNWAFKTDNFVKALENYTESVAVAPPHSTELAFAYANRSAVLLSLGKHHECLVDINRALQENYPEDKKPKLKKRKDKCIEYLQTAIRNYKSSPPNPEKLISQKWLKELAETFDPESTDPPHRPMLPLPEVDLKNELIANASEKIKMENMPGNKVRVVATANIESGEVLVIEKPVAWNLMEDKRRSHCATCCIRTQSLIHCPNCSRVMFCSVRCRENACTSFHRVECEIFGKFSSHKATWGPVKTLLVISKQGEELDQLMNDPACQQPLSKTFSRDVKEKFDSQKLSSVFRRLNVVGSNDSWKDFSSDDELDVSDVRPILNWLYLLRQSTFFGERGPENRNLDGPLTNRELYVVKLLMRLDQAGFQGLKEATMVPSAFVAGWRIKPFGYGLFPMMNHFSHSCDPHATFFCYNNILVCRAVRPIENGEEITICYSTPYHSFSKFERKKRLREKYSVSNCRCKPCRRDWPTQDDLPLALPKAVVSHAISAKKCREYSAKLQELWDRFDLDELAEAKTYEFLREYLAILDKRFKKPCREFIHCQELLGASMHLVSSFCFIDELTFPLNR